MKFCFSEQVLGKHQADYFRCARCGLIKPRDPEAWLAEAYSSAIASTDIGIISRNISNLRRLEAVLWRLSHREDSILDVGGGYGILCRGLRDKGFNCYTTDVYCENLFARDFEPTENFKAEILLAFEVFEHVPNPLDFVREQLERYSSSIMIFSTLTYGGEVAPSRDWWYYTFETGQHISIYHSESIRQLGISLGLYTASLGNDLHIISKNPIDLRSRVLLDPEMRLISWIYYSYVSLRRRRISLLGRDYEAAKKTLKKLPDTPSDK